ncbi:Oidioi.mRNA.OKI2018_I69.XSR.g16700.t1.cds [Oikopleura dioica]|uniref:Oidioi.mRNA.OKI2018_I69.XSR.g16700.t1.cds n=1 Tax=Oikopleura dioica TaxID=34765 RepID=A0ABN7SRC8_OIKDI|nr:Oidioi.mRNA.OKI2018_I69.XSR.g16700.t1.cds [Oikopleura dioica]
MAINFNAYLSIMEECFERPTLRERTAALLAVHAKRDLRRGSPAGGAAGRGDQVVGDPAVDAGAEDVPDELVALLREGVAEAVAAWQDVDNADEGDIAGGIDVVEGVDGVAPVDGDVGAIGEGQVDNVTGAVVDGQVDNVARVDADVQVDNVAGADADVQVDNVAGADADVQVDNVAGADADVQVDNVAGADADVQVDNVAGAVDDLAAVRTGRSPEPYKSPAEKRERSYETKVKDWLRRNPQVGRAEEMADSFLENDMPLMDSTNFERDLTVFDRIRSTESQLQSQRPNRALNILDELDEQYRENRRDLPKKNFRYQSSLQMLDPDNFN